MKDEKCPCGSGKTYADCCAKPHKNLSYAKTAEELMRSRYTAFVYANGDYLMESYHSSTRKPEQKKAIVEWAKGVEWLGLEIIRTKQGQEEDDEGIVEFKAHYKEGRKRNVLHQRSKFLRESGNWVYVDVV